MATETPQSPENSLEEVGPIKSKPSQQENEVSSVHKDTHDAVGKTIATVDYLYGDDLTGEEFSALRELLYLPPSKELFKEILEVFMDEKGNPKGGEVALEYAHEHLASYPDKFRELPQEYKHLLSENGTYGCLMLIGSMKISPPDDGFDLEKLKKMPNLKVLDVCFVGKVENVGKIGELSALEELKIANIDSLEDDREMEFLSTLKALKKITVGSFVSRELPASLQGLESLEEVVFSFSNAESLDVLKGSKKIKKLKITGFTELKDINALEEMKELEELEINSSSFIDSFNSIGSLTSLKKLTIRGSINDDNSRAFEWLRTLHHLEYLQLDGPIETLDFLKYMPQIKELRIKPTQGLTSIEGLEHAPQIQVLEIDPIARVKDLSVLGSLTSLKELSYGDYYEYTSGPQRSSEDLEWFQDLHSLESLYIMSNVGAEDLDFLRHLPKLKKVRLYYWESLKDIEGLYLLDALEEVEIANAAFLQNEYDEEVEEGLLDEFKKKRPQVAVSKYVDAEYEEEYEEVFDDEDDDWWTDTSDEPV